MQNKSIHQIIYTFILLKNEPNVDGVSVQLLLYSLLLLIKSYGWMLSMLLFMVGDFFLEISVGEVKACLQTCSFFVMITFILGSFLTFYPIKARK